MKNAAETSGTQLFIADEYAATPTLAYGRYCTSAVSAPLKNRKSGPAASVMAWSSTNSLRPSLSPTTLGRPASAWSDSTVYSTRPR